MKQPTILIVEDDQFVLNLLDNILTSNDYAVVRAKHGIEALERLSEKLPDVIISDIMMPEMNGYELIKKMQESPRTRHIPFLFLSAKSEIRDRVEGLSVGADDYICKPFAIDELLARVQIRLKRKKSLVDEITRQPQTMTGDLTIMPIVDLIQLLHFGKKTGEIVVTFSDVQGSVKLNNGEIVDVTIIDLEGDRAFRKILEYHEGWFTFTLSETSYPIRLHLDTQFLIVDSAKKFDDYHRLLDELPNLSFRFEPVFDESNTTLPEELMETLARFDDGASLNDVLQASPDDKIVTAGRIRRLFQANLLRPVPEKESKKRWSLINLPSDFQTKFFTLLEGKSSVQSIVIIQLADISSSVVIDLICGKVLNTPSSGPVVINRFTFRKIFIGGKREVNVYAIQGISQFAFLSHIIDKDMLGLFIVTDTPSALLDDEIIGFGSDLRKDNLFPVVTIQIVDEQNPSSEGSLLRRLVREYPDTVHHCRTDHDEDFIPVLDHWLQQVQRLYSLRR